jgi:hypothetical protein
MVVVTMLVAAMVAGAAVAMMRTRARGARQDDGPGKDQQREAAPPQHGFDLRGSHLPGIGVPAANL